MKQKNFSRAHWMRIQIKGINRNQEIMPEMEYLKILIGLIMR